MTKYMTTRQRREAKIERLTEWADKRQAKADAIERADRTLRDDLAFVAAQPGIGRSSIFKRTNAREEKEFEHRNMAASMDRRAAGIEAQLERTIFDDDPDAIDRLKFRIASLEARRDLWKEQNAAYRIEHKAELKEMSAYGRDQAMPRQSFELTNIGADIRRNKERLAKLEREQTQGETPRYLYSVRYASTCRDCGQPIEQGAQARYYKKAGELACYPACQS